MWSNGSICMSVVLSTTPRDNTLVYTLMGCLCHGLYLVLASLGSWGSSWQLGVVFSICHQHASPRKVCHPMPLQLHTAAWMLQPLPPWSGDTARMVTVCLLCPVCKGETVLYLSLYQTAIPSLWPRLKVVSSVILWHASKIFHRACTT